MPFTIPTEFFKGPEEVVEEKEENAEKLTENENLKNEFTEKTQPQAPPNTNIEKTEQIEDQQFETKNPELQNPAVEVKIQIKKKINHLKIYFPECVATLVHNCITVIILQFQSANTEVVSSFSPPVESQSAEVSGTSTPPIDSSPPPSQSQLSSASQVEPASTEEFEVS